MYNEITDEISLCYSQKIIIEWINNQVVKLFLWGSVEDEFNNFIAQ